MANTNNNNQEENGFLVSFILYICRCISLSVEVFLHSNIGERYITSLHLLCLLFFYLLLTIFLNPYFDSPLMWVFFLLSIGIGVQKMVNARKRHKEGVEIHSYYNGFPLIGTKWNMTEGTIKMYVEPFLLIFWGVIIFAIVDNDDSFRDFGYGKTHYGPSWYLMSAGTILFIKGQIEYYIGRNRYLDAVDKKIESEMLSTAIQGRTNPKHTKGFSIPGTTMTSKESRNKIEEMYLSINPELLGLMNKGKEKGRVEEYEKNVTQHNISKDQTKAFEKGVDM